jgi:hypothetical protein
MTMAGLSSVHSSFRITIICPSNLLYLILLTQARGGKLHHYIHTMPEVGIVVLIAVKINSVPSSLVLPPRKQMATLSLRETGSASHCVHPSPRDKA